jgi:hypothetical protein
MSGIKPGYDYSHLNEYGMIQENTALNDKIVLIGQITSSLQEPDKGKDASTMPKKGQLGFVDKAFITEGEEGKKLAKVRIREERIPAIGDKMASRAGQKGTLGLIIPEEDMPFTADGIRPDLIINPHALPSRMTIGQLVESVLGKLGAHYGGFGDCTAFANKGSHAKTYGEILTHAGYHSSGNQLLYNGYTGEPLAADIYIGPTYYMRLKHMVKDKINYRARGPRTALTRQPVQGRANDGGLRIGEMERDGVLAHGASAFLNESFLVRGDEYLMAVCNKTGSTAIYNPEKNLFLSPFADGAIQFAQANDGKLHLENVSRFGRSFSLVQVPYSLKLLMQELLVMNVQMRIITDDNIDQLLPMSFSENIIHLAKDEIGWKQYEVPDTMSANEASMANLKTFMRNYNKHVSENMRGTSGHIKKTFSPVSEEYSPSTPPGYENEGWTLGPVIEYAPEKDGEQKEGEGQGVVFPALNETRNSIMNNNNGNNKNIDFGSEELNTFFQSLSQKNKTMITDLKNPNHTLLVLKKVKERYDMKKELQQEQQTQQQQQQQQQQQTPVPLTQKQAPPESVLSPAEKASLGIIEPVNPLTDIQEEKKEDSEGENKTSEGSSEKKTIKFS